MEFSDDILQTAQLAGCAAAVVISTIRTVIALDLSFLVDDEEPRVLSFTIFTPLFRIRSLMDFDLSYNCIQGELLGDSLANMSKLVSLDLDGNSFQGNIPKEIGNMTKLQQLSLSYNNFFGEIPASILNLKELKELYLSDNSLSMEIPIDIGNLSNITTLDFSYNKLTGTSSIQKLTKLETLYSQNNLLTGTIPSSIQKLTKLKALNLENNKLTGDIPSCLFNIKGLVYLYLGGNNLIWNNNTKIVTKFMLEGLAMKSFGLAGEIPDWIPKQKTLAYLDLSENQLEGMFPLGLLEMNLVYIDLSDNKLKGSLPPSLFNNTNLSVLSLSRNNFYGELPSNIGEIPTTFSQGTRFLSLAKNKFSGRLSRNLSYMSNLEYLDIHDNKITGELPHFICQISTLQILNLQNNSLQGSIPDCISNLASLRILDLSSNHLVGEIPAKFRNLVGMIETPDDFSYFADINITYIGFEIKINDLILNWKSNNKLTGKIPVGSQMDTMDDPNFYANNSGLCGMQIKVPCLENLSPTYPPEVESKETWFSWEGVGIGYAVGFFVAVGNLYLIGYFVPTKPPNHRRKQRMQRI
ncbi:receptor-like protein 46 [Fagus crenata]